MTIHADIVVYGGGGHGKVVADIAIGLQRNVLGFIDDIQPPGTCVLRSSSGKEYKVLGNRQWLLERPVHRIAVALGIGDNLARKSSAATFRTQGILLEQLVHSSACVSQFAKLGRGTVVMALAAINPGADIAEGVIINTGAVIEHDVVLGEYSHVSPNATLAGAARVGAFSHIGTGAVLIPRVRVGENCIVGAGAVVTRDIPDGVVAVGVPAREIRRNSS